MTSIPFLNADRLLAETFLEDARLFGELRSTNDYAAALALEHPPTPLLIAAEHQTAGRGRGTNRWLAGEGALTFSVLIEPAQRKVPVELWPILSLAVGVSVCTALESLLAGKGDVRLKWPNDVYLDGRKVCGILVESPPRDASKLVVGIGLNVNNRRADCAPDIAARMTSVADAAGRDLDRTEVLIAILQQLAASIDELAESPAFVIDRCREKCYLTGRLLAVSDGRRVVSGSCQGIDDDGALRIATETGLERCMAGSVEILD